MKDLFCWFLYNRSIVLYLLPLELSHFVTLHLQMGMPVKTNIKWGHAYEIKHLKKCP